MGLYGDVRAFHERFALHHEGSGAPRLLTASELEFRFEFMREELTEFKSDHDRGDLCGAADALADLVWVVLGTAHLMHLPFDEVWAEVRRANMSKVRSAGDDDPRSKRKSAMDVVKPDGWVAPDHAGALERAATRIYCPHWDPDRKWDRRMMELARHFADWSKDPRTRVGAVVVAAGDRRKMSHGYNGFPPKIQDTPERLADRDVKNKLVQHAEMNALDNATFDTIGGTLFSTRYPCSRCALSVVSRRLARVVTTGMPADSRWRPDAELAGDILSEAGVVVHVVPG